MHNSFLMAIPWYKGWRSLILQSHWSQGSDKAEQANILREEGAPGSQAASSGIKHHLQDDEWEVTPSY